jgi:dihydrofolate synthase/folylpolyglutamate synthase
MSGLLQFGIRLDRERFVTLLHRLNDPHKQLRCVHVAGTNGKGSTTTFIASVLRAAGYRVGAYLSPYVYDLRERIQIGGAMIPEADFARWVSAIRPHIEALAATELGQTTEFELKTAVAFCWFAEQAVDYAVIEVGIGGRLDATNVIPPPLVAVVTSIGWDHMNLLGDTLGKIAAEKAGIFKAGTTAAVTAVPPGEALEVIAEAARRHSLPLRRVTTDAEPGSEGAYVTYSRELGGGDLLRLTLPSGTLGSVRLGLRGAYQAGNAAAAAATIETLRRDCGVEVSDDALRQGLAEAFIPGRFQVIGGEGGGPTLVLDGAHNEDGAHTLLAALRDQFGPEKRYTLVFGTSRNHAPQPFLEVLAPVVERVVATAPSFRPTPAEETAAAARALNLSVIIREPAPEAIRRAWAEARPKEVVVVTGSLYTVGETPPDLRR